MASIPFSSLPLDHGFLKNLDSLGYSDMTEIQAKSLPDILSGIDVLGQAKTGSGKTAAYAIGLLNKIEVGVYQVQSLVICPTRELADQVTTEIRRIARASPNIKILTLCGGKPMGPQLASLEHSPHIVVGTPGRLLKLLEKRALTIAKLSTLVLDEADRMLDMGFKDDIIKIIKRTPTDRQTLLFSATYADEIKKISRSVQTNPKEIHVANLHDNKVIQQVFYAVGKTDRTEKLIAVLQKYNPQSSLVFCTTRQQCQELASELIQYGIKALALHGELEQFQRDQALVQFSNKSLSVLVATDVAARGLDIDDLSAVINYEISADPEVHIHRIGRTGRAGKTGLAITLAADFDFPKLKAIEAFANITISVDKSRLPKPNRNTVSKPPMTTLFINAGRKDKLRPGDVLGSLTSGGILSGDNVGKIAIFDKVSYVAVDSGVAKQAVKILAEGKIKGRKYRSRLIR